MKQSEMELILSQMIRDRGTSDFVRLKAMDLLAKLKGYIGPEHKNQDRVKSQVRICEDRKKYEVPSNPNPTQP